MYSRQARPLYDPQGFIPPRPIVPPLRYQDRIYKFHLGYSPVRETTSSTLQAKRSGKPREFPYIPPNPRTTFPQKHVGVNLERKMSKATKLARKLSRIHEFRRLSHVKRLQRSRSCVIESGEIRHALNVVAKNGNTVAEDNILLREAAALQLDHDIRTDFLIYRGITDRAESETPQRLEKERRNDEFVEEYWRLEETRRELKRERRKLAEERQVHEAEVKKRDHRQKQKAKKRQLKEIRAMMEERHAKLYAKKAEKEKKERERKEQENDVKLREAWRKKQERIKMEKEEEMKRQEELRQAEAARQAANQEVAELHRQYATYDAKWSFLKMNCDFPLIDIAEFPWPILNHEGSARQTPEHRIREFIFHPLRPGMEGKTQHARLRTELLRWHPDKFNKNFLLRIQESQRDDARGNVEEIGKLLSLLLEETSGT